MGEIYLYDSLSNKKRQFEPIDQNHVRIYACGPTVYNYAHIGNARMAVVFDSFVRLLRNKYPNVTYVSNITDIDDKIIEAANESNIPINELTKKFDNYKVKSHKLSDEEKAEFIEDICLVCDQETEEEMIERLKSGIFTPDDMIKAGIIGEGTEKEIRQFKENANE